MHSQCAILDQSSDDYSTISNKLLCTLASDGGLVQHITLSLTLLTLTLCESEHLAKNSHLVAHTVALFCESRGQVFMWQCPSQVIPLFTKQYNLVPAIERCRFEAGKVTVSLSQPGFVTDVILDEYNKRER